MDIFEFIHNNGKEEIPNPLYNPRSRKNNQPKTLLVDKYDRQTPSQGVQMAIQDFRNQNIVNYNDIKKYSEAGINWNPQEAALGNYDKILADRQSNWDKAFNMLGQTLVSEIGLGTLRGFTDLYDFLTSKILHVTEDDYQNPASEAIQEWQDIFNNEIAPIYVDPNANIQNGGLKDFGWWMKNLPQVASTLTLFLPARGITAGISALGKIGNVGHKLGKGARQARRWATGVKQAKSADELTKFQLWANKPTTVAKFNQGTKNIAEGSLMRIMENYQESRDTHIQTYENASNVLNNMSNEDYAKFCQSNQELVNEAGSTDKDILAKHIAKKAADRTFAMDFSNLVLDIWQLHELGNIGKGIKKATGRRVREAHRESIKAAEDFAKGTTSEIAKTNPIKKGAQITGDFIKGNAKLIAAESSEGIEEAVNYIAQQEGLSYGKLLLEGKDDRYSKGTFGPGKVINTWTNMNGSLRDYMRSPELQESAFWGVMGGWIFGGLGNAANRAQLALYRKATEKNRKENPITGEKPQVSSLEDLLEMPESKAARLVINGRQAQLTTLSDRLKEISNNRNPFATRKEDGQFPEFEGDAATQQAIAKQQAIDAYISTVTLQHMNSGTIDMLLDYIDAQEVKDAMVKAGASTKEEIDTYTVNLVNQIKKTKELYERQSTHVLNQIAAINANRNFDDEIPLEYANLIAESNTKVLLGIESIDKQIAATNPTIAEQEAINNQLGNPIDSNEAKAAIKINTLTTAYVQLDAKQRLLESEKPTDGLEKLAHYRELEETKNAKKQILKELAKTTITLRNSQNEEVLTNVGVGSVFHAIRHAGVLTGKRNAKGEIEFENNKDFFYDTDANIIKNVKDFLPDDTSNLSDESISTLGNKVLENQQKVAGTKGLINVNEALYRSYQSLTELETQKLSLQQQLYGTIDQIRQRVDYLHNFHNEARQKLLDKAEDIIITAWDQYNGVDERNNIVEAIVAAYEGDRTRAREITEDIMSDDNNGNFVTAAELMDALDIFHFSQASNQSIYEWLMQSIAYAEHLKDKERASESVNSTENLDENSAAELSNQTITSSQQSQRNTQAPTQPQSQFNANANRPTRQIGLLFNNREQLVGIKNSSANPTTRVNAYRLDDGTFELDVKSAPRNLQLRILNGSDMFDFDEGVDLINTNDDWVVAENPIVDVKNKGFVIHERGRISNESKVATEEVEQQVEQEPTQNESNEEASSRPVEDSSESSTSPSVPDIFNGETTINEDAEQEQTDDDSNVGDLLTEDIEDKSIVEGEINPLTGGLENLRDESKKVINVSLEDLADSIYNIMFRAAGPITRETIDVDGAVAAALAAYKNEIVNYGITENKLNEIIEEQKQVLVKNHQTLSSLKSKLAQKGFALGHAARVEEADIRGVNPVFKAMFESFMEEYSKIVVTPEVDGKKTVRLEHVLRIVNNSYNAIDSNTTKVLYDSLVNYLLSPEGKSKYLVLDENYRESVISKATESIENRKDEEDVQSETQVRVFIDEILSIMQDEYTDKAEKDRFFKVYNSLRQGDKLELKVNDRELLLVKDGVTVGVLPKPTIKNNRYQVNAQGIVIDVTVDANGNIISNSKDIIKTLLTSKGVDFDKIRELLTRASVIKSNKDDINEFFNIPVVNLAIQASFNNRSKEKAYAFSMDELNNVTKKELFNHLVKIWKYTNTNNLNNSFDKAIAKIQENLDKYYSKLYNSYNSIYNIQNNQTVTITKINDGGIVRASELGKYSELPLVKEVLADKESSRIAIVDFNDDKTITISNKNSIVLDNWKSGSTMMAIYGASDVPSFAKAYGIRMSAKEISNNPMFKKIGIAVGNILVQALHNIEASGSNINHNELEYILRSFINFSNNEHNSVISLLAPCLEGGRIYLNDVIDQRTKQVSGLVLEYKDKKGNDKKFRIWTKIGGQHNLGYQLITNEGTGKIIYKKDKKGNSKEGFEKEIVNALLGFFEGQLGINISDIGIKSDNVENNKDLKGFITRENGKTKISIGTNNKFSVNEEYDSYNDFLVDNNLLRVNTKKTENGTNFISRSENQKENQILYVSLPIAKPTNVITNATVDSETNETIEADSDVKTFNSIKNAISSNTTNVGEEILNIILPESDNTRFTDVFSKHGILDIVLPKQLGYDAQINEYQNGVSVRGGLAYTKRTEKKNGVVTTKRARYTKYVNGEVKLGRHKKDEDIVIGNKLLNMLSSNLMSRRYNALRTMIHEQIHLNLNNKPEARRKLFDSLKEVYDEFKRVAENDIATLDKNDIRRQYAEDCLNAIKNYTGDVLSEEFLVESLTRVNMINYLNMIETEVGETSEKKSLLSRILDTIMEFFNIPINEKSLLMKELNILKEAFEDVDSSEIETMTVLTEEEQNNLDKELDELETETNDIFDDSEQEEYIESDSTFSIEEDIDEDYDELPSATEEANIGFYRDNDGYIRANNLDAVRASLPIELQSKFEALEADGWIETKCK